MADHGVFSLFSAVAAWFDEHMTLPRLLVVIGAFLVVVEVLRSDYRYVVIGARMIMGGFALIYLCRSVTRKRWRDEYDDPHASITIQWPELIGGLALLGGVFVPSRLFLAAFQYLK
jgi:hypothetical protein